MENTIFGYLREADFNPQTALQQLPIEMVLAFYES